MNNYQHPQFTPNNDSEASLDSPESHGREQFPPPAGEQASRREAVEFHVTFGADHGHAVRTEVFDDEAAAERFAARRVLLEHEWAVIDAVPVRQQARTAA